MPTPTDKLCPCCKGTEARTIATVPYSRIFVALAEDFGAKFDEAEQQELAPAANTHLRECNRCQLQYFAPSVPGNPGFYTRLLEGGRSQYEETRWEFDVVKRWLRPDDHLVDFGCGRGAFLQQVAPMVTRSIGVDGQPAADKREGFTIVSASFNAFAVENRGAFTVATAFHTLEHMAAADDLLMPAINCLAPGGRLVVSVPNRERSTRGEFEVLDMPPHHQSRWSVSQLSHLSTQYGLVLERLVVEPYVHNRSGKAKLKPALGPAAAPVAAAYNAVRYAQATVRTTRQEGRWSWARGFTLLACYRKL